MDRLFYNCGKCPTCLRTKSIFDKIGYDLNDSVLEDPVIAYKDHNLIDNLKIKNCENYSAMTELEYNNLVTIITKDAFKYVG